MTDELKAEVERDIQAYNSAFIRANHEGDPTLMRKWMRLPVMVLGNGSVRMLNEPEDIDTQYGRGIDALKGTDYERSVLSDFDITVLNPTTSLVLCHAVRERADGSVIAEFDASYLMARGDTHWQIACLISRR